MKIKAINRIKRNQEDVYNLEVQDNNNYFVENICVSNCHNLEQNIINHAMLEFTSFDIKKYKLGSIFSIPKVGISDQKKIQWLLEDIYTKAEKEFESLENELAQTDITSPSYNQLSKLVSYYSDIISKCEIINEEFLLDHNNIIILQDNNEKITFKLLFGKKLFERTLLGKGQKILHMSATLPSKAHYCETLNLDTTDVSYIKVPSIFPIKNRPIIYMPVGKMSYAEKSKTFPKLLDKIDKILDKYSDVGGIIHTQSNALTEDIITKSKHSNRFIFPKGKDRQNMIDMYTDLNMKGENKVLISPSLHEGLNLEGPKLGSFNIICKIPFPHIVNEWVKKRMAVDDKWYNEETVLKIVQSTGRTTRSKDDKSVSFILDECFTNVYKYNKACFPLYWQQSLIGK